MRCRRSAASLPASRAKNGPKKGPALKALIPTATDERAAKPRANTSHLTLSCGANRSQFPRLIGAVPPAPSEAAHARAGRVRGHFRDALKRHARARPWQRTTPWTAPAVMMMRRRRPAAAAERLNQLGARRPAVRVGGARFVGPGVAAGRRDAPANGAMKRSDAAALARQKARLLRRARRLRQLHARRARREPVEAGLRAVAGLWVCGAPRRESG